MAPCSPNSSVPSPKPASRCPPGPPKKGQGGPIWSKMNPRWAQKGAAINGKILQNNFARPLGPILGTTSANLDSTWAQLGPSKPIVKPSWHPSYSWQGVKPTAKPPNNQTANPREDPKKQTAQKFQISQNPNSQTANKPINGISPNIENSNNPNICFWFSYLFGCFGVWRFGVFFGL